MFACCVQRVGTPERVLSHVGVLGSNVPPYAAFRVSECFVCFGLSGLAGFAGAL